VKDIILKQAKKIQELENEIHEMKEQNAKDKSDILQGVNEILLEFLKDQKYPHRKNL